MKSNRFGTSLHAEALLTSQSAFVNKFFILKRRWPRFHTHLARHWAAPLMQNYMHASTSGQGQLQKNSQRTLTCERLVQKATRLNVSLWRLPTVTM